MHIDAYNSFGILVGSYVGTAGQGKVKVVATGINFFEFHNSGDLRLESIICPTIVEMYPVFLPLFQSRPA